MTLGNSPFLHHFGERNSLGSIKCVKHLLILIGVTVKKETSLILFDCNIYLVTCG